MSTSIKTTVHMKITRILNIGIIFFYICRYIIELDEYIENNYVVFFGLCKGMIVFILFVFHFFKQFFDVHRGRWRHDPLTF